MPIHFIVSSLQTECSLLHSSNRGCRMSSIPCTWNRAEGLIGLKTNSTCTGLTTHHNPLYIYGDRASVLLLSSSVSTCKFGRAVFFIFLSKTFFCHENMEAQGKQPSVTTFFICWFHCYGSCTDALSGKKILT